MVSNQLLTDNMMFEMVDCFTCSRSSQEDEVKARRLSDPGYSSNNGSNLSSPDLTLVVTSVENTSLSFGFTSNQIFDTSCIDSKDISNEARKHNQSSTELSKTEDFDKATKCHSPLLQDPFSNNLYPDENCDETDIVVSLLQSQIEKTEKTYVSDLSSDNNELFGSHKINLNCCKNTAKSERDCIFREWQNKLTVKYENELDDDLEFLENLTSANNPLQTDVRLLHKDHSCLNSNRISQKSDREDSRQNLFFEDIPEIESSILSFMPETTRISAVKDTTGLSKDYSSSLQSTQKNLGLKTNDDNAVSPLACLDENVNLKDCSSTRYCSIRSFVANKPRHASCGRHLLIRLKLFHKA